MTWEQKILLLKFEAELYELYVSKIEQVKAVLKSFDGRQVNVRITGRLQEEIPRDGCTIYAEKYENSLRICFASNDRGVNVGTESNRYFVYADNEKTSILCVDAVKSGRLDYQVAEPQIDKKAADWLSIAKEYKTTDYAGLLAEYKGIANGIKAFQNSRTYRIRFLLGLEFEIKYHGYL